MAAPARAATPRIVSYGLVSEGAGAERKWVVYRITSEGDRVLERKVIERSRWRDLAEDAARRALWGKA